MPMLVISKALEGENGSGPNEKKGTASADPWIGLSRSPSFAAKAVSFLTEPPEKQLPSVGLSLQILDALEDDIEQLPDILLFDA